MKKLFFFLLTAVCAMFYAPTADAVINSMRLVGTYNSQSLTLTLTPLNSAGTIWRWIGTNNDIKPSWTRTYQYQLEVDKDDDTTENWYYSSSGYSFSSGNEYSADGSWAVTTGNNYFTFNVTYSLINTTNYSVTVILSADKQSIAALRFEEYTAPVANVFMPLSRRDFDAGPRYFLVGTRTSDWRLQPEWEMTVNADRTEAALQPGRLMYKQLFGIAKVDCYDDYIMHRYTLYSCKGASVTSPNQSFDLEYIGLDQATRYKVTSTFHNDRYTTGKTDNYMKWCSDGTSWTSDDWIEAKPALITSAIITLDSGGNPVKVTFEYDTSENTIAKHRSFTLVGEDIKYDGQYSFSDDNKSDLYEMTHVYDSGKNTTVAWGTLGYRAMRAACPMSMVGDICSLQPLSMPHG